MRVPRPVEQPVRAPGQPVGLPPRLDAVGEPGTQRRGVLVGGLGEHLVERHAGRRQRERVGEQRAAGRDVLAPGGCRAPRAPGRSARSCRRRRAGRRRRSTCPSRACPARGPSGRSARRARRPGCGSRRARAPRPRRRRAGAGPAWKPSAGWITPVLVIAASASTQATSPPASSRSTASRSLYGTTRTLRVASGGRPRPSGSTPAVAQLAEQLVRVPVVLAVEHQHRRAAGHGAGEADRLGVRLGRRERELPERQPEAPRPAPPQPSPRPRSGSRNCGPAAARSPTARAKASIP